MAKPKSTVKATTPDHIVFGPGVATINYEEDGERELGMTAGGSTWDVTRTVREIEGDGLMGPTRGLKILERVEARLTVRLKDITKEDILLAIAGADSDAAPVFVKEVFGLGNTGPWTPIHAPDLILSSLRVYAGPPAGELVLMTDTVDYTVNVNTQVITRVGDGAIEDTDNVTAEYRYEPVPAGDWDTITGGPIETADYLANVTISAAHSSYRKDIIFMVKNALPDGPFSMSLEDKAEGVVELVFLAHFTAADQNTEPWEFRFPKT